MTHFRRMDPQPTWLWNPVTSINTQFFVAACEPLLPGLPNGICSRMRPEDMPSARPWRDRDGTWY